jgi:hypothetical protein
MDRSLQARIGRSMQANVARTVARLVSKRATPITEIPVLVEMVHAALLSLERPVPPQRAEAAPVEITAAVPRPTVVRRRRAPEPAMTPPVEVTLPAPPLPRLLRRAEVAADPAPAPQMAAMLHPATLRGIVKWFDPRTRRCALRLPGISDEVVVEPSLLDEMAIQRLYKGQEVEATLSVETPPRVMRLTLPGGAWQLAASGGVVHNRHARPVVVELKREALKRVAARAEAELVLGRRSGN